MQLAKILPDSLPLELRVRVANKPVVAVRDKRATATLRASIDIFSPPLQSAQQPLFSLDTVSGFSGNETFETGSGVNLAVLWHPLGFSCP